MTRAEPLLAVPLEIVSDDVLAQYLARLHPLNQLPEEALARLRPALRIERYKARARLYEAGEAPRDCFYVLQGCVCLFDPAESVPLLMIRPEADHEMLPLPYALPAEERAVVMEDSLVLRVERGALTAAPRRAPAPVTARRAPPAARAPEPLPAAVPSAPAAAPVVVRPAGRVLLVQDDVAEARVCRDVLKALDLKSDWVRTAEEALELLELEHYTHVLLDLHLPSADSFDVVKHIRERAPGAARPRLIALAEPALADDHEGCRAAGLDDLLCKPVAPAALKPLLAPR
jgi:CheY-like chemotaxis protein